jgi:sporulation protein YlmC with PRC-barrel domain
MTTWRRYWAWNTGSPASGCSTAGDELGTVTDVEFDGGSGSVTRLRLDDHEVAGVRLRGVGSYAVVVTAE